MLQIDHRESFDAPLLPYLNPTQRAGCNFNMTGGVRGEARIVERALGIGPSGLTESVVVLAFVLSSIFWNC